MKHKKFLSRFLILGLILICPNTFVRSQTSDAPLEEKRLETMHSISSQPLYDYVAELTSEKYEGRLTGTEGYHAAANWVASLFAKWGLEPFGDDHGYFQYFDIPYTLVFKGCELSLNIPYKNSVIEKHYRYVDDFIPAATSGSGEITAEVVYVGYGATAPELGYDDYKNIDVKGKIVMIEGREVPVSPNKDPELFKKWRPYSFHQYKLENAAKHGAKGMLYISGPAGNPNNSYIADFIHSLVAESVVSDIFSGTGKTHKDVLNTIIAELKPRSFATGKVATIKNVTEHHPEGKGSNVIGLLKGSDPGLSKEIIIVGAHLDHLGKCYELMPGANDNASGVATLLGIAEAISKFKLKRSVMFICFGAEEQAVVGSKFYLENPNIPLEKTLCFINMDAVGCGDKIRADAAENYPALWTFFEKANSQYIHRVVKPNYFHNLARPRLDAARFMWAGVPTISFGTYGAPINYYHVPKDDIHIITPEIMEDLAQLIFMAVVDMTYQDSLDFRK